MTWLGKVLEMAGADVTGYALEPPTSPNLFEMADLENKMNSIVGDIRDLNHLKKVFELVKEYLAEDGVFIFDLNTVHKYRDLMGECTISENREESSFIWENYFYEDEMVNEYDLTLFIREESDLYRKYEELHYQKAYELEQVKELLLQAGMEFVAAYDAFTHDPVTAESERMYIIARPKVI